MRKSYLYAATVAASLVGGGLQGNRVEAADHSASCDGHAATHCGCQQDSPCRGPGHQGLLHGGIGIHGDHVHLHRLYDGADLHYNCGCNGSYKFPVPPLYTYHWPGLYSQQLMTDYQSPWRFPPLRPYAEEPDPVRSSTARSPAPLRSISTATSAAHASPESSTTDQRGKPMSQRVRELYRY